MVDFPIYHGKNVMTLREPPMYLPLALLNRVARVLIALCTLALCLSAAAQESYLVSTTDGLLSLYDLSSNTLKTTTTTDTGLAAVVSGQNNRLAFAPNGDYLSIFDTTIQREVKRLTGVNGLTVAITPDKKTLLVGGQEGYLRVVDTATLTVVRVLNLKPFLGPDFMGAIVTTATKAYAFPLSGLLTNVAVIDLATYSVKSIPLPAGQFDQAHLAAVTPDGKTIVAMYYEFGDGNEHALFISTVTNAIVADLPQSSISESYALVITPQGADPSKLFGYLLASTEQGNEIVAFDLRPNSPTYGEVLPLSGIPVQYYPDGLAINSDGTRLIAVGQPYFQPAANTYVIDALKMITDPSHSTIAQVTAGNGGTAYATCTGFFSTTPPNTAPVVSGVSGDITNDADREIQISGSNFQPGALVSIGNMAPLPANVNDGGSLTVTVLANAPAGNAQDIVVTNPETAATQDQQYQSGLLAGKFNILLNPNFQPTAQFSTINDNNSISAYSLKQRQMVNVAGDSLNSTPLWSDFNVDGKQLYLSSIIPTYPVLERAVFPVDLVNNVVGTAIILPGDHQFGSDNVSASVDPNTGKPVINAVTRVPRDMLVSVINSDAGSPAFNTVIRTFDSGSMSAGLFLYSIATAADGKFAYIWYRSGSPARYFLEIVNLTTGTFTQVTAASLGINQADSLNGIRPVIAPDGKTLLLSSFYSSRWHIEIIDISKPTVPRRIAELTPTPVPGHGFPVVTNYQVVGAQLYAFDPSGIIVVFNFNRNTGDFRERGWYVYPAINTYLNSATQFAPNFAFSPDGQWLYVADPINDLIAVLDPAKLIGGTDAVFTTIRAPYYPYRLAVSPVVAPSRLATVAH